MCPRLVDYRREVSAREPEWFNGAVPSFGDPDAKLLVVGLAPGVTGANRTGRPFTGDHAGGILYTTLARYGFANDRFDAHPDDGLELVGAMVTNAVRCVPPQNKPVGAEINACRPFLVERIRSLSSLLAIIALGRIAHDSLLRALGVRLADHPFGHAARHRIEGIDVIDSYHCSRYNTNTGRLTQDMFDTVFASARQIVDQGAR